jgi:hypothetical protein
VKSDGPPQLANPFARLALCARRERQRGEKLTSRFTNNEHRGDAPDGPPRFSFGLTGFQSGSLDAATPSATLRQSFARRLLGQAD